MNHLLLMIAGVVLCVTGSPWFGAFCIVMSIVGQ